MIWLTNKWGDTSTHSFHFRNANQLHSYFTHGQRPPIESLTINSPNHIISWFRPWRDWQVLIRPVQLSLAHCCQWASKCQTKHRTRLGGRDTVAM